VVALLDELSFFFLKLCDHSLGLVELGFKLVNFSEGLSVEFVFVLNFALQFVDLVLLSFDDSAVNAALLCDGGFEFFDLRTRFGEGSLGEFELFDALSVF